MDAIRIARAYTGRDTVIKILGSYHEHHDYVMVSSALPSSGHRGARQYPLAALWGWYPQGRRDMTAACPSTMRP